MVIEADELTETQRPRQRTGFVGDPLHQTAIAHKHPGIVIDNVVAGTVKLRRQRALGNRHADGVGQPLAKRAGGCLDAGSIAVFRVAGRFRMELAKVFQFGQRQIVAGQMQQAIQQHRRMTVREHKAVTIIPVRILRIVFKEIIPQDFGDIRHPHRGAGVAGVGFLYGVHAQGANGVGKFSSGHNGLLKQDVA